MQKFNDIKNKLRIFGLSENQIEIYLLLVTSGELRIQEIFNLTKIPRSSIYDNIKILSSYGLVEKIIEENFTKIKPYPLTSIKHSLNEKLLQVRSQIDSIDYLDKIISNLAPAESSKSIVVRFYKGVSGARQLLWNTLKTKETIYVFSEWGRGRYVGINFYKEFVQESLQREIKEKVIVNPTERVIESIKKYSGTSVGRTLPKDIKALNQEDILIKGETFIYDNIYAQLSLKETEICGFEIESSNFTQMQKSIFETLWKNAQIITDFF